MQVIDLRGICCPSNFVRAKLALEEFDTGQLVRILLDDGEPVKNVPRSLKDEGHKLIGIKKALEGHYEVEIEKGED